MREQFTELWVVDTTPGVVIKRRWKAFLGSTFGPNARVKRATISLSCAQMTLLSEPTSITSEKDLR
jgi:hypothetical protein